MLIKNKNSFILYIAGLTVGLVLLNLISRDNFFRFDLTDNKKFSLSLSSEAIISKLDDRLTIKVYFSDDSPVFKYVLSSEPVLEIPSRDGQHSYDPEFLRVESVVKDVEYAKTFVNLVLIEVIYLCPKD